MNHPLAVGIAQRVRHFPSDLKGLTYRQLPLATESVAQRLTVDVRHGIPQLPRGVPGVVKREDVGVLEAGRELDLAVEPLGPERVGQVRVEDFERDRPIVLQVVGQEDRGHAAAPELALEHVALS
jgi:hypothetical protein